MAVNSPVLKTYSYIYELAANSPVSKTWAPLMLYPTLNLIRSNSLFGFEICKSWVAGAWLNGINTVDDGGFNSICIAY